MLLEPREDVGDVEDGAACCAYWVAEGLERDGAEVEGEAFEGGIAAPGSASIGSSTS